MTPDAADVVLFTARLIPQQNVEELHWKCAKINPLEQILWEIFRAETNTNFCVL